MDTIQLLQASIQAATMRQSVYANNIANAETPGYKRQDVAFETYLQSALQNAPTAQMGERHIPLDGSSANSRLSALPNIQPVVYTDQNMTVDNNGNNVDLTNEMSDLAENQVRYDTLVQDVSERMARLESAITGS